MKPFFALTIALILILLSQNPLRHFRVFLLKKKIKNNPFIGIKQPDNSYYYSQKGYTISYRIKESPPGIKTVEWLFLKRRLTFFEEKIVNIKRSIDNFFLYQRWFILFRPSLVIILITAIIIFYFGIKEQALRRVERFKWVISRITGVNPESIGYAGRGWFKIYGQRMPLDKRTEPVTVTFNPLSWLFFPKTINISRWDGVTYVNRYFDYPVTISNDGDVWLRKESSQIHGKVLGDNVIWDEPQGARKIPGHDIIIEDGKLKIIDE